MTTEYTPYYRISTENVARFGYDPRSDYREDYGANDEGWDE